MVATLVPDYLTIPLHYFLVRIFTFEFQYFTGCRNQIKKNLRQKYSGLRRIVANGKVPAAKIRDADAAFA